MAPLHAPTHEFINLLSPGELHKDSTIKVKDGSVKLGAAASSNSGPALLTRTAFYAREDLRMESIGKGGQLKAVLVMVPEGDSESEASTTLRLAAMEALGLPAEMSSLIPGVHIICKSGDDQWTGKVPHYSCAQLVVDAAALATSGLMTEVSSTASWGLLDKKIPIFQSVLGNGEGIWGHFPWEGMMYEPAKRLALRYQFPLSSYGIMQLTGGTGPRQEARSGPIVDVRIDSLEWIEPGTVVAITPNAFVPPTIAQHAKCAATQGNLSCKKQVQLLPGKAAGTAPAVWRGTVSAALEEGAGMHHRVAIRASATMRGGKGCESKDAEGACLYDVTLVQHVLEGMYLDIDELRSRTDFGIVAAGGVCSPSVSIMTYRGSSINTEAPAFLSFQHAVGLRLKCSITSTKGAATLSFGLSLPVHLRYPAPLSAKKAEISSHVKDNLPPLPPAYTTKEREVNMSATHVPVSIPPPIVYINIRDDPSSSSPLQLTSTPPSPMVTWTPAGIERHASIVSSTTALTVFMAVLLVVLALVGTAKEKFILAKEKAAIERQKKEDKPPEEEQKVVSGDELSPGQPASPGGTRKRRTRKAD